MATYFRRSSYYNRVVVPVDLRAILERGEILRSLRTKRYRVACTRGRLFEARVAHLFDHLREHHHTMTPETIQALVRTHIEQSLDEAEQDRAERSPKALEYPDEPDGNDNDLWVEGYEVEESRFAEALYCNDLSVIEPLADSLIVQSGIQVDRSAGAYLRLCRELLKASIKVARAFTDDDITSIFNNPKFISQRTGEHPERYWLVLLLAYSGARREEIAQMLVGDIKQDKDGLWFLDILPDDARGTTVKNEASKRRTPLHSRLVDLGLLSYVSSVRKKHGDTSLLFPIPVKTRGRSTVGDAVGKWFKTLTKTSGDCR